MNWKFWKKEDNQNNKVDFDNLRIVGFVDTNNIDKQEV